MADSSGNPMKDNYFPIVSKTDMHSLDIIVKKNFYVGGSSTAPPNEVVNNQVVSTAYQVGDRIAIRLGRFREISNMNTAFSNTNGIDSVVVVASASGIIPLYSLLKQLLTDSLSTVARVEVLWLNSQKEDFILHSEIEELELCYSTFLSVSRVIDHDLWNTKKKLSSQIPIATMPFRLGRMALMLTPATLHPKINTILTTAGYSKNSVMAMTTGLC